MLSDPRTSESRPTKPDPSADFIHDLAEAGTASELGTVKAASDAVEGEARKAGHNSHRRKKTK